MNHIVNILRVIAVWLQLVHAGYHCALILEDDFGPEMPNRVNGPTAKGDTATGVECLIGRFS